MEYQINFASCDFCEDNNCASGFMMDLAMGYYDEYSTMGRETLNSMACKTGYSVLWLTSCPYYLFSFCIWVGLSLSMFLLPWRVEVEMNWDDEKQKNHIVFVF